MIDILETDPEMLAQITIGYYDKMHSYGFSAYTIDQFIKDDFVAMRLLAIGDLGANDNMDLFIKAASTYTKKLILYQPKLVDNIKAVSNTYGNEFGATIDATIDKLLLLI